MTPVSHYNLGSKKSPYFPEEGDQHMPSFEQDHEYLLEYSHIFEPKKQYSFNSTFTLIDDEISMYEQWEEFSDGPITGTAQINCTPDNWYTQYWSNCASRQLADDLDGYEFREICNYIFEDDETIYTGHFLDLY